MYVVSYNKHEGNPRLSDKKAKVIGRQYYPASKALNLDLTDIRNAFLFPTLRGAKAVKNNLTCDANFWGFDYEPRIHEVEVSVKILRDI